MQIVPRIVRRLPKMNGDLVSQGIIIVKMWDYKTQKERILWLVGETAAPGKEIELLKEQSKTLKELIAEKDRRKSKSK
jgi:hypothetical protein